MLFGFSIGIAITLPVFLRSPPPFGFGLSQFAVSGVYATPIVYYSVLCLSFNPFSWQQRIPGRCSYRRINRSLLERLDHELHNTTEPWCAWSWKPTLVCCTLTSQMRILTETALSSRPCYLSIMLYVCGFVVLGAAFQNNLTIGAVIMGWAIAMAAIMINTVAVCKCLSCSV